jgi:putative two-component system response regulator
MAGRIVAIADVFDALTSKRPYKEPYSVAKSLDIVRESSGTHFDPDVVEAFFAVEDEILATKEKYKDKQEGELTAYVVAVKL